MLPLPGSWRAREWRAGRARPLVRSTIYERGTKLDLSSSWRLLSGYVIVDMLEENQPDVVGVSSHNLVTAERGI